MFGARVIEFSVAVLAAFLILAAFSFLSLRPALKESRVETAREWERLLEDVRERNEAIEGLVEALRGYESGRGKLAESLLEARAVSLRAVNPETVIEAVDHMESSLAQVRRIAESGSGLGDYPPFSARWNTIELSTQRIQCARRLYNKSVRTYNRLLRAFPQNVLAGVFGFTPLKEYPLVTGVSRN